MWKWTYSACLSSLVLTGNAVAQQAGNQETVLDTIVVTAPLRREADIATATSSVTVIDEDDIRSAAAHDIGSLLQSYPGVSVTSHGGLGSLTHVSLRGTSSTQTLVLVNGVRVASATTGSASVFNIPLSAVSRIEIAKGPHSAQYGSDAIGGVINIITRDGANCPDGKSHCSTITTGVSHPWGGHARIDTRGSTEGGLTYAFGGGLLGTRGYDFTIPSAWGHEPDDDGFFQGSFDFRVSQDFDWGRLYADGLYSRGRSQFDDAQDFDEDGNLNSNEADTTTFAGKLGARVDHAEDWFSTVEVSSGLDKAENFRDGVPGQEDYETRRYGILATTQKSIDAGKALHVFSGGVEAYREKIDSSVQDYVTQERSLAGVFGQYALEYEAFNLDAGVRYDYNEQFGDATTYNIGGRYELVTGLAARASFGTGFRAPTFNDLYYPGFSNPDLLPERSRSVEAGLLWEISQDTSLDLAVYRTWISDAIAFDALPYNIGSARITGFEAVLNHQVNDRWNLKAGLDIRDPRDEDTGDYIANRERLKASLETGFKPNEKLSLTAKLLYGGSRHTGDANPRKLPDYVTVDLTAVYAVDAQSEWRLAVLNAFDADYATRADYRAPGRTVNLSFSRNF